MNNSQAATKFARYNQCKAEIDALDKERRALYDELAKFVGDRKRVHLEGQARIVDATHISSDYFDFNERLFRENRPELYDKYSSKEPAADGKHVVQGLACHRAYFVVRIAPKKKQAA